MHYFSSSNLKVSEKVSFYLSLRLVSMHLAAKPELNRYVCWKNIKCFMMEYTPRTYQGQYIIYWIFIMFPLYIYIYIYIYF